MRLLVATANPGKLREFTHYLQGVAVEVLTPEAVGLGHLDPEETGSTFKENSTLKAIAYGKASGLMSVADDSGLEVAAVNGEPGVMSKRYIAGSDQDRNQFLLQKLEEVENRQARFVTMLTLFNPSDGSLQYFEGILEGVIAQEAKGTQGFGYDPIFIPNGQTKSLGELGLEIKNQMSHRAQALAKLRTYLLQESAHE